MAGRRSYPARHEQQRGAATTGPAGPRYARYLPWGVVDVYPERCVHREDRDRPFTGVAYEVTAEGRLVDETSYWTGFRDGPCAEWWPDDHKRLEGTCHNGVLAGWFREWDSEGRLTEESLHDERSVLLRRRWNEEGELTEDYVSSFPAGREAAEAHPTRRWRTVERSVPISALRGHGPAHGIQLGLWPDGRRREEGRCHHGVAMGWWCRWDSEGELAYVVPGDAGRRCAGPVRRAGRGPGRGRWRRRSGHRRRAG